MPFTALLPLAALVALAFLVETASGFGSTVVALTVGGLFLPLDQLLAVLVPLNMVVSAAILLRDGRSVDWGLLTRGILPLMALGMGVGMALARALGGAELKMAYAALVMVLAAVELTAVESAAAELTGAERPPSPRPWFIVGGIAHGAFAASGPVVVYALDRVLFSTDRSRTDRRVAFRATLAALWLASNGLFLLGPAVRPLLSARSALLSVALLPALAAGMVAGDAVHRHLSPQRFRRMIFALMLAAGAVLFASAL